VVGRHPPGRWRLSAVVGEPPASGGLRSSTAPKAASWLRGEWAVGGWGEDGSGASIIPQIVWWLSLSVGEPPEPGAPGGELPFSRWGFGVGSDGQATVRSPPGCFRWDLVVGAGVEWAESNTPLRFAQTTKRRGVVCPPTRRTTESTAIPHGGARLRGLTNARRQPPTTRGMPSNHRTLSPHPPSDIRPRSPPHWARQTRVKRSGTRVKRLPSSWSPVQGRPRHLIH